LVGPAATARVGGLGRETFARKGEEAGGKERGTWEYERR